MLFVRSSTSAALRWVVGMGGRTGWVEREGVSWMDGLGGNEGGEERRHTFYRDSASPKSSLRDTQYTGIVGDDDWYDIHPRLHR